MKKIWVTGLSALLIMSTSFPALAKGNPVDSLARQVQKDSVYDAKGKRIPLVLSRPTVFFAWWCPHCHKALKQLQADHLILKLNFVSVWPNEFGKYKVTTLSQAQRDTEKGLHVIGISIPASHLFFTLPTSALSSQITMVPTLIKKERQGYFLEEGTPAKASEWMYWLGGKS